MSTRPKLPLIYSCSGCSSAAQMANSLAVRLDRKGIAEMSCIAGVGGDVASLVRVAKSGKAIIAIDGCALNCVQACLKKHDLTPSLSFTLSDYEIKKTFHEDYSQADADRILDTIEAAVAEFLSQSSKSKP